MLVFAFIASLPGYLLDLPWHCQTGESFASGGGDSELALCRPDDTATSGVWALRISEAMGRAGLHPIAKKGSLGLHIAAITAVGMLSATFVQGALGFDVWLSEQTFAVHEPPETVLPAGVSIVTDHKDGRNHLLSLLLSAPLAESAALVHATLAALGADRVKEQPTKSGEGGDLFWQGERGTYQARSVGPKTTALVLFTGQNR